MDYIPSKSDAENESSTGTIALLAGFYSTISPGVGQLYTGQWKKGILFLVAALIYFSAVSFSGAFDNFFTMAVAVLLWIGMQLYIFQDAVKHCDLQENWCSLFVYYYLLMLSIKGASSGRLISIGLIIFIVYSLVNIYKSQREDRRARDWAKAKWYQQKLFLNACLLAYLAILSQVCNPACDYEAFISPSSSMSPALIIGDRFMTSKQVPREISRGSIVTFLKEYESSEQGIESITIVKRVVGLPGETIEVKKSSVLIDGAAIDEPYAVWNQGGILNFGPHTIPEGHYFLIGDNRDASKDSRSWEQITVPRESISGIARYVYFNSSKLGRIGKKLD